MRGYTASGPSETGTANKTAVAVIASATVRPRLFEFAVSVLTPPNATDQQLNFALQRFTVAGTAASAPTPLPLDPADVAAVATAGITHSAEPTYTAGGALLNQCINQRSLFRWVAAPGYEFMAPATAANGLGLRNVSITATSIIHGTLMWME
jgi:hypothetical protein